MSATYPDLEHHVGELSRYIEASGIFSILLINGGIVHFIPEDASDFREWLYNHNIENIRNG